MVQRYRPVVGGKFCLFLTDQLTFQLLVELLEKKKVLLRCDCRLTVVVASTSTSGMFNAICGPIFTKNSLRVSAMAMGEATVP